MGKTNQSMFSPTTPHFFKIILEETLEVNKLRIPKKFEKLHGETLSKEVFLKLPCGLEWKMGLENYDEKLWLTEGWPEFFKHFSLKRGSLLVFRYEGNSKFNVIIFDESTMEIDYPYTPVQVDEPNIGEKQQSSKGKEILECNFPEKQSPVPTLGNPKRRKTTYGGNETRGESLKRNRNSYSSKPKTKGDGDKSTTQRTSKSDVVKAMKPLRSSKKAIALEMARGFKSKNPSFEVVMQPSYVIGSRLKIPVNFASKHLKYKSGHVKLVSRGRTWSVNFTFQEYREIPTAKLYKGWKLFAEQNNLEIGDVCVFVLTKVTEISFEVTIFRANEKTSFRAYETGGIDISSDSDYETGILGSHFPTKQATGHISTPQTCRKQEGMRRRRPLTPHEKAIVLERTCFKSDNPFFKVVMQPTYTSSNSYLPIPFKFAKKYINKNQSDVILRVLDGKFWSAKCIIRNLDKRLPSSAGLYSGWTPFAVEHNLEVGDVCIFELVTGSEKTSFRVFIVRLGDSPSHRLSSRSL